jgi:hypothetical protein
MHRMQLRPVFLLLVAALAACASPPQTGIMAARWTPPADSQIPEQTVTIAWESEQSTNGQMTFTLGRGGERYVGSYILIENTTSELAVQPLYSVWESGSGAAWAVGSRDWFVPGWSLNSFVRHYNGRVVVGLHGDRGDSARCHFTLADTEAGIPGGGTGACAVSDGGQLTVRF